MVPRNSALVDLGWRLGACILENSLEDFDPGPLGITPRRKHWSSAGTVTGWWRMGEPLPQP